MFVYRDTRKQPHMYMYDKGALAVLNIEEHKQQDNKESEDGLLK